MKIFIPPPARALLSSLVVAVAIAGFAPTVLAQDHGAGIRKSCPQATKVGDIASCTMRVINEDDFGDTLVVKEFWDIVDEGGPNEFRNPPAGNLPIIEVSAGVTCAEDNGNLVFPCTLPGAVDGSGEFVRVLSEYVVPEWATDPLLDQANATVADQCDVEPVGCSPNDQGLQFGAAVSLFTPALEVSKTGPDTAKVGDQVTYTIGFTDTSSGTGFPGFENCTGTDSILGNLGDFVSGVPRDFNYTVQAGDDNPLQNTATITCGVVGFNNEVTDSDSHSFDWIDPSIDVTKSGPASAKVGDEITYTIGFVNDGLGAVENCTGTDSILGNLGAFVSGVPRDFNYTVQAGDDNPLQNTATITCGVVGFNNEVTDSDSHSLDWIDPAIEVTKSGPDAAKVGDEITYTIGFANTGIGALENCIGTDTILGNLGAFEAGVNRDFNYTVQAGDDNPLQNTATITCGVVGFNNEVTDSDSHSLDWIDPAIEVTKSGPDAAKVGDEITYTIGFDHNGSGAVENCTGTDTVLGNLGDFVSGVPRDFNYTVQAGDDNPLQNTATITCGVVGFNNEVTDSDSHSLDWVSPSVELAKLCRPDPVVVGESIEWSITVENTGDVGLDCLVNDAEAGIVDEAVVLAAGETSAPLTASRTVLDEDFPLISNTASVVCDVNGFDNTVDASDSADCEVEIPRDEICRTPGFWGTHAGTEKRRSSDLTQLVIDAAAGDSLSVCGQTIDNTAIENVNSAVEAMCVRVQGEPQRQLARQLTAMALNCVVSGGGADCTGTSVDGLFADADAACIAGGGPNDLGPWIERVDCFNNGGDWDDGLGMCVIGTCSADGQPCDGSCPDFEGEPQQCVPFEGNCHDRELDESTTIFDGVSPLPGPAGSSRACSSANGNGWKVVPAPFGETP